MSVLSTLTQDPQRALSLLSVLSQNPVQAVHVVSKALTGLGILDEDISMAVAEIAAAQAGGQPLSLTTLIRSPAVGKMLADALGLPPLVGEHVGGVDIQSRILSNIPSAFGALQTLSDTLLETPEQVEAVARAVEIIGVVDAETVVRFVKLLATRGVPLDQTLLSVINSRQVLAIFGDSSAEPDDGAVIKCPYCDDVNYFSHTPMVDTISCGHCQEMIFIGE